MNKELAYIFSTRIKERMKEKNISQQDLALLSGISKYNISRYINAERLPDLYVATRLAETLDCSVNYLLGF